MEWVVFHSIGDGVPMAVEKPFSIHRFSMVFQQDFHCFSAGFFHNRWKTQLFTRSDLIASTACFTDSSVPRIDFIFSTEYMIVV